MSAPIEEQLRDYFTMVDRTQGPVGTTPQGPDTSSLRLVTEPTRNTNEPTMEVIMLNPDRNEPPATKHRWMMVAASIAALVVVGLLVVAARDDEDPAPADQPELTVPPEPVDQVDPDAVSVLVPGTEQWTDTGISLSIGDTVSIEADGTMTPDVYNEALYGPDGVPDRPSVRIYNVEGLEEQNHNSLIGRIGEVGAPFPVGSQLQFIVDTEGRLFLGINDTDVANNAGVFTVMVTVNPSSSTSG